MSILDTAKDIYDLAKKGATLELQEQLIKLREEAVRLQEENLQLREKVKSLEEQLQVKVQFQFDGSAYWKGDPRSKDKEGPYCQRCYDADMKVVRLQSHHYSYQGQDNYSWQCRACGTSVAAKAR
jgi:hypothetical protein